MPGYPTQRWLEKNQFKQKKNNQQKRIFAALKDSAKAARQQFKIATSLNWNNILIATDKLLLKCIIQPLTPYSGFRGPLTVEFRPSPDEWLRWSSGFQPFLYRNW